MLMLMFSEFSVMYDGKHDDLPVQHVYCGYKNNEPSIPFGNGKNTKYLW